jgi:hypothetical protein
MSMMSNVGNAQIHEANEQRCVLLLPTLRQWELMSAVICSPDPQDNEEKERFHSGKRNIHDQFDSK